MASIWWEIAKEAVKIIGKKVMTWAAVGGIGYEISEMTDEKPIDKIMVYNFTQVHKPAEADSSNVSTICICVFLTVLLIVLFTMFIIKKLKNEMNEARSNNFELRNVNEPSVEIIV